MLDSSREMKSIDLVFTVSNILSLFIFLQVLMPLELVSGLASSCPRS